MVTYSKLTSIGSVKREEDDYLLCATKHTTWAYYTDNREVLKDFIVIKYKLEDTVGVGVNLDWGDTTVDGGTGYHQDAATSHKIRIKIYNDGKKVYEDDLTGDKGVIEAQPYLINKAGLWEVKVNSISEGECSKISGTSSVGKFMARVPIKEESSNGTNNVTDNGTDNATGEENYNGVIFVGAIVFLILGIRKMRKGRGA